MNFSPHNVRIGLEAVHSWTGQRGEMWGVRGSVLLHTEGLAADPRPYVDVWTFELASLINR